MIKGLRFYHARNFQNVRYVVISSINSGENAKFVTLDQLEEGRTKKKEGKLVSFSTKYQKNLKTGTESRTSYNHIYRRYLSGDPSETLFWLGTTLETSFLHSGDHHCFGNCCGIYVTTRGVSGHSLHSLIFIINLWATRWRFHYILSLTFRSFIWSILRHPRLHCQWIITETPQRARILCSEDTDSHRTTHRYILSLTVNHSPRNLHPCSVVWKSLGIAPRILFVYPKIIGHLHLLRGDHLLSPLRQKRRMKQLVDMRWRKLWLQLGYMLFQERSEEENEGQTRQKRLEIPWNCCEDTIQLFQSL